MDLKQRSAEITERAPSDAERQLIALRDHEANTALVEAREQAFSLVAAMRNDFNEARVELTGRTSWSSTTRAVRREVSNQLLSQEVHGQNGRLEMRYIGDAYGED